MKLQFLGGTREVGRSSVLVNDRLLLDCGSLTATPPQFPVGNPEPEAIVVSHGHLDHVGAVPALLSESRRLEVRSELSPLSVRAFQPNAKLPILK